MASIDEMLYRRNYSLELQQDKEVKNLGVEKFIGNFEFQEDLISRYVSHYNAMVHSRYSNGRNRCLKDSLLVELALDDILDLAYRATLGRFKTNKVKLITGTSYLDYELDDTKKIYEDYVRQGKITDSIKENWDGEFVDIALRLEKVNGGIVDKTLRKRQKSALEETFSQLDDCNIYGLLSSSASDIIDFYRSKESFRMINEENKISKGEVYLQSEIFEKNAEILAYSFFIDYRLLKAESLSGKDETEIFDLFIEESMKEREGVVKSS